MALPSSTAATIEVKLSSASTISKEKRGEKKRREKPADRKINTLLRIDPDDV